MNRIELLSQMAKVNAALNANDYGQMALALGMTKAMVEEMSIPEIIDAMTVRLADLNKELERALRR
jgi:hypothetical protein